MILKRVKTNPGEIEGENCYVVQDENTKETMIVDPGEVTDELLQDLEAMQVKLKYIVLTHCHGDHIAGVNKLKEKFGGDVLIHRQDAVRITRCKYKSKHTYRFRTSDNTRIFKIRRFRFNTCR